MANKTNANKAKFDNNDGSGMLLPINPATVRNKKCKKNTNEKKQLVELCYT